MKNYDTKRARKIYDAFLNRHLEYFKKSKSDFLKARPEVRKPARLTHAEKDLFFPSLDIKIDLTFSQNKIIQESIPDIRALSIASNCHLNN